MVTAGDVMVRDLQAEFNKAFVDALAAGGLPPGKPTGFGKPSALSMAIRVIGVDRNRGRRLLEKHLASPGTTSAVAETPVPEPTIDDRIAATRLRDDRSGLRRQLDEAHREIAEWRASARHSAGLREQPPDGMKWPAAKAQAAKKSGSLGVPCFLWSDWHIGETVFADQMHGVNRYDRETAEARVGKLAERCALLATSHHAKPDLDRAVLFLDGDFVSGWQHDEHVATDWCTPLEAVRHACSYLRAAIERLLGIFGNILVVCCTGNHGRLFHRRPPAKIQTHQSFDWLIYGFLEDLFAKQPRLKFATPNTGDFLVEVEGTRYLAMHGHELGVRGGDALIGLIGPMVRGRLKVGRSQASYGRDFDVLVLGHFHDPVWLPAQGIVVNNSLVGFNEYAMKSQYVATTPAQMMWWTDPKWGPASPMQVFVEDRIK